MAIAQITNTASDTTWGNINNTQKRGNTFTPASNYSVSAISVKIYRNAANTGTVTCTISATTAGLPSGAALGTATMAATDITTGLSGAVYTFNFASPVAVTSGTTYAYYLSHDDADGTLYVRYGANEYAGGTSLYWNGSAWSAGSSYDYYFIIYSPDTSIEAALSIVGTSSVTISAIATG